MFFIVCVQYQLYLLKGYLGSRGQFHVTKLSIVSSQLEREHTLTLKTRRKFSIKYQRNSSRWSFALNICLMKLTPATNFMSPWVKYERNLLLASKAFRQVEFYPELLPHEIGPRVSWVDFTLNFENKGNFSPLSLAKISVIWNFAHIL